MAEAPASAKATTAKAKEPPGPPDGPFPGKTGSDHSAFIASTEISTATSSLTKGAKAPRL